jgi:TPR repeat protein
MFSSFVSSILPSRPDAAPVRRKIVPQFLRSLLSLVLLAALSCLELQSAADTTAPAPNGHDAKVKSEETSSPNAVGKDSATLPEDIKATPVVPADSHIELINDQPYLTFPVDGHARKFLIDTGADHSSITTKAAQNLIDPGNHSVVKFYGYGPEIVKCSQSTRKVELQLPGISCRTILSVLPPDPSNVSSNEGVIGLDLLSAFRVRIDYAKQTIVFSLPDAGTVPAGAGISTVGGKPVVPITLIARPKTLNGFMRVETGNSDLLTMQNRATALPFTLIDETTQSDVAGDYQEKEVRLTSCTMTGIVLPAPDVGSMATPSSRETSDKTNLGAVGGGYLHLFCLTLDLPHGRFFLEPNAYPDGPLQARDDAAAQASSDAKAAELPDIQALLVKAQAGDAPAQTALGMAYENGKGATQDFDQAAVWLTKAAAQKDAQAENELGNLYLNGKGVPQSDTQAVDWYRKAAGQDNGDAEYNLGYLYDNGHCVKQDDAKAADWYRKAATHNNAIAQATLGYDYLQGNGVSQDYAQAAVWLRKAAAQDNASAQENIGYLYENEYGVPLDRARAMAWYRKAAGQNQDDAQFSLGSFYEWGLGVAADLPTAIDWYQKSASHGDSPYAQSALARLHAPPSADKVYYADDDCLTPIHDPYDREATLDDIKAVSFSPAAAHLEIIENHIYGTFLVEGRPWRFLIDTGAPTSSITPAAAKGLLDPDNHSVTTLYGYGPNLVKSSQWTRKVTLGLPGITCKTVLSVIPPDPLDDVPCDGCIGLDIVSALRVQMDYAKQTIVFSPPDAGTMPVGPSFFVLTNALYVPVSLAALPVKALDGLMEVDTGDAGVMTLQNCASALPARFIMDATRAGVGGEEKVKLVRLTSATFAGLVLHEPEANATPAHSSNADVAKTVLGAMGGGFLHHFCLTFDLPHNRLYVEPTAYPATIEPQTLAEVQAYVSPVADPTAQKDRAAAVKLRQRAGQDNADAEAHLGYAYLDGEGVIQDYGQAAYWFRKAAAQNHAHAEANLGSLYEDGFGVPMDDAQALAWYRKAAAQNDRFAEYSLGVLYECGLGATADLRQALVWYHKSAAQGFSDAQDALERLHAS